MRNVVFQGGGGRLKTLCTAVILGTFTLCGMSAHATDIYTQGDLTNSANYSDGSVLNVLNPINLSNVDFRNSINGAVKVVIDGGNNDITGTIWASDQDSGDNSLQTGHYTIQANGANVTFQNMSWKTDTNISNDGWRTRSRSWTTSGGIAQNAGTLNITNSTFSSSLNIEQTRTTSAYAHSYINGGIIDNTGTTIITDTDFNNNEIKATSVRDENSVAVASVDEAIAEVNGGLISNTAANSTMTITGGTISGNKVAATVESQRRGWTGNDIIHSTLRGGMIYNVGNLEIKGTSITGNEAGAIANNNTDGESIANAYGGIFYNEGTLTIGDGTEISGNRLFYSMQDNGSAEVLGGAIYNTGTLNLGDVTFSNNKHHDEALNDIYATANSVINVTGRSEIGSGLQSADTTAQINVQNGGNLVLVGKQTLADGTETIGDNDGYTGNLNVAQGAILTLKGTDEKDTLAAALTNATSATWADGSGLAFDVKNDIAARPGQNNPAVTPNDTISAEDISSIIGSNALNVDIYKLGDNYITFSDDYSAVGRNVYVKDGTMRFFVENNNTAGGSEKYFNGGNANTYISDGAKFIYEISGEENNTTFSGNLISETVAGEVNKAEFQKAGDAVLTLAGDNSAFNGNAVVEWGELVIDGNKSFFGENANIVVDSQWNFTGDTGMARLTYNNIEGGVFNQNVTLKSEGVLSINGSGRGEENAVTINNTILSDGTNNVINLSDADFTLNTNLGSGQILNFNNAGITLGENVTSLEHAITMEAGSALNLADNATNNYTFGNLQSTGTNNISLDVNLAAGTDGQTDVLNVGAGSSGLLTIADVNVLGNNGAVTNKTYTVINNNGGNLGFAEYSTQKASDVYIYDIKASGSELSLIATAIAENGLKHQNHFVDGTRPFTFVGNSAYVIEEDLENTLAGTFTVSGKSDNASDSIFSGGGAHSFFEVGADTNLTLENLTIQDALASKADADAGTDGASANINGAVVSATGGTVNLDNVVLQNNHADGNGGAIYASGDAIINGTSVVLSGNTAGGLGSAIYAQDNAKVTLNNSSINGSGDGYVIYNNGAAVTLNNVSLGTDNNIYNSDGTLNINNTSGSDSSLGLITGGDVFINESGSNNIIIGELTGANLELKNGTALIQALSGSTVTADTDTSLSVSSVSDNPNDTENSNFIANGTILHLGGNINGGSITINDAGEFIAENNIRYASENTEGTVKEITAKLTGNGIFTKEGQGYIDLKGAGNGTDFTGTINVDDGRLRIAAGYGLNKDVDITIDNGSVVDYYVNDGTILSDDTVANFILGADGPDANSHLQIVGNGRDNTNVNIKDKFWEQNQNAQVSFWNGAFTYSFDTAGIVDNMTFHNSDIMFGNLVEGTSPSGYVSNNGDISLSNSSLELLNKEAGDIYNFNRLVSIDESAQYPQFRNKISLDVNLFNNENIGITPYGDKIVVGSGSTGILHLDKLFITDDNGRMTQDGHKIQIIDDAAGVTGNTLQLATQDGVELLSWATNIYKYGIDSATTEREADSILISPDAPSSSDTLRDLNIYNSKNNNNSRGFSFVVNDLDNTNTYNIYRDLDATNEGNFTILGKVLDDGSKSVLSGKLEDLLLDKGSVKNRLVDNGDGTYTYLNADGNTKDRTFSSQYVTDTADGGKIISVEAMADGDTNGSFFELTNQNSTDLEISDVTIRDAMRYQNDAINGGSVIYSNSAEARVTLQNVDMINNQSYGNGGAINNVQSYVGTSQGGAESPSAKEQFTILGGNFSGNKSETGLGGAIYTASNMYIKDAEFSQNGNFNTHYINGTVKNNDIYLANGSTVTFDVTNTGYSHKWLDGGLAGEEGTTFDKIGAGTLHLDGSNEDMLGLLKISEGEVYYLADSTSDTFIGGSVYIAKDAKLTMSNNASFTATINNLSGEEGALVYKEQNGSIILKGDNSNYNGKLDIHYGSVDFSNENGNTYISGVTDISNANARLNYTTVQDATLSNVLGTGSLNKNGSGNLEFNYLTDSGVKFSGTANANEGTLTVNAAKDAADDNAFDFKMIANGGNIVYNAIAGQTYTINNNSNISFADGVNTGSVTFNGGTYELGSSLAGQAGDKEVIFDGGSTIYLTTTDYNTGKFTVKDALIDVADNAFNTYTFDNLNAEEGSELMVDLAFDTANGHQSDKIISKNGSGTLTLTTLNLRDGFYDDGLTTPPDSVEFEILGGGLKLGDLSLKDWATDVYHYTVTTDADKQSVILTADDIANELSLGAQNVKDNDIRGFQFLKEDEYVIGNHLGQTADGIFTVQGIQNADGSITSHIKGDNQYSMFDVVNDNTDLRINDVEISQANKDGNGSVLSHTSDSTATITNANIHDNNSTGKGGAIYVNSGTLNLEDVTFANNNHGDGANDIYIEGGNTQVNYIATNDSKNSITSGIAGSGILNKTGDSELTISGSNENFTGNLVVSSGTLNFEQNSSNDTYIKGTTTIANAADVVINTDMSEITTGAFVGGENSAITKNGDFDMTLSGDNSQFKGTANINAGNIIWNTDDTTFFGGKTNLAADTGIVIEGSKNAQLTNISGAGTIGKDNSGTLVLYGDNSNFNGNLAVNQGVLAVAAGTEFGNLQTGAFAGGTSINLQNTAAVENADGSWTTNPNPASIENLNFETLLLDGDVNLYLDVDLANEQADKITANNVTVNNNGHLVIGPGGINLVSDALVRDVSTQIVSGNIAQYVMLDDAARTAMGPIQKYMVDYANGYLSFAAQGGSTPSYSDVNPGIMASPVAAQLGGYLVQLHSYDEAFRNMDMYMLMTKEQRQAMKMKNKIASAAKNSNIVFDPTVSRYENKSGWFRPYATFESVSLDNGPKVSNVAYGSFFGAESEMYDLGHGWDGIWSVYGGYNGSHQAYDGIGIYQNGGTLGVVGMAYKGNFFTGLTANTGASVGEAQTGFGQDNFTMLMAGVASKSGYNIELADGKLIIQPNFTMSYSFVNTFDYHSAAGVSISSDPLHAIHLEPGIKLIGNLKNGWQPYGSVSMIWNIMDNTQFMANQVSLPELSVKPFVKYGVGVRKSWGERFTGFFQTYITNGGRNGVGLQLGFRWMLGNKSSNKKITSQTPQNKKVIKSMK